MTRTIVPLLLAVAILTGSGCAPEPPEPLIIEMTCERFAADPDDQVIINRHVQVQNDTEIILRLCEIPGTGFQWQDAAISDRTVVVESLRESLPPDSDAAPGTPELEQWTFQAVGKGSSTIAFSYDRPWSGGEKGAWQFNLFVTVA